MDEPRGGATPEQSQREPAPAALPGRRLIGVWLGRRRYAPTYALQLELFELKKRLPTAVDLVLLLEHEPVITLGRGAKSGDVLVSHELLARRGIDLVTSDRGGEVTLHAPGQLVCYPIVALAPERCDVRRYVNDLSAVMRGLIAPRGIDAGTMPGLVGLWVDRADSGHWNGHEQARTPAKIGAIGVRLSRWVTLHGFALNLELDLGLYELIVPCGIRRYGVTSLGELSHAPAAAEAFVEPAWRALAARLEREPRELIDARAVPFERLSEQLSGLLVSS
jgi:lipoyl(octanoyl) transferase